MKKTKIVTSMGPASTSVEIFTKMVEEAKKLMELKDGDHIIITGGFRAKEMNNTPIPTNLMKIHTI